MDCHAPAFARDESVFPQMGPERRLGESRSRPPGGWGLGTLSLEHRAAPARPPTWGGATLRSFRASAPLLDPSSLTA